jgi:predicted homoserine dehydrogenase-like protein
MMRKQINRRAFLQKTSAVAAVATLASMNVPHVFAAEDNTIRLALIGCGGRGSGAVANALATTAGPVKLVAMADVFEERIKSVHANLTESSKEKVDVTPSACSSASTPTRRRWTP